MSEIFDLKKVIGRSRIKFLWLNSVMTGGKLRTKTLWGSPSKILAFFLPTPPVSSASHMKYHKRVVNQRLLKQRSKCPRPGTLILARNSVPLPQNTSYSQPSSIVHPTAFLEQYPKGSQTIPVPKHVGLTWIFTTTISSRILADSLTQ